MGLVAGTIGLLLIALLPRRIRERLYPSNPDLIRKAALFGVIPVIGAALLMGWHLRQQFILNEPMANAASQGEIEEVRALLDKGAWADSWGVDGMFTALTGASEGGHTDVVKLLLAHGANPNMPDHDGKTALKAARMNGNKEIEQALLKAGAKE